MANGHGGARRGAGRPTLKFGFRAFCREVIGDPVVQAGIKAAAQEDPLFALKVAEHGFGRPPQSLDVKVDDNREVRREIYLHDGTALPAAATTLPAPGIN